MHSKIVWMYIGVIHTYKFHMMNMPAIVFGDFNMQAHLLHQLGWAEASGLACLSDLSAPTCYASCNQPTCIDLVFASKSIASVLPSLRIAASVRLPHHTVTLDVPSRPRVLCGLKPEA